MVQWHQLVIFALDHLQSAVVHDLASRYCPPSKGAFLMRFWLLFALFVLAAPAAFLAARRRAIAWAVLVFAIGAGALVLYGLSGCNGAAAAGLFWEWP